MLQFLPAIAGLLQNKQKQAEQAKQDEIAAYMGHAPGSGGGGGGAGGGLLQGLGGLLGGLGGEKKKPDIMRDKFQDPGNPTDLGYDPTPPEPEPDGDEYL
jgi:hypothetical protein